MARVCLAVFIAAASFFNPLLNAGTSAIPRLLSAYVAAAAIALLFVLLKPARWPLMTGALHVMDLSFATAVMLVTDPGTPTWILVVFVLLAAAHRWGLRATILTAAVMAAVLLTDARVAGMAAGRQVFLGPALILLGGVALAYVTQAEKQFRAEAAALGAVVSRVQLRSGLKNTMAVVLDAVAGLTSASRAVLVVHEIPTGLVSRWDGGSPGSPSSTPQVQVTPIEPDCLEHYLFAGGTAAWHAVRPRGRREQLDVVTLEHDGSSSAQTTTFPKPFLAAIGQFRGLMSIGFEIPGELTGRLFLVDPRVDCGREPALALGQRMIQHLCPAVHSVYLLHRLGSRSAANERARVARELHDGIIQGVLAVELQLRALSGPAAAASPGLATELTRLGNLLSSETALLRDMMQGLTPRELPPAQLMDTLAAIVQRFELETGITARFVTTLDSIDLTPRGCRELTRIVQEALVNVRKHSGARNVIVRLTAAGGACQLSIDDDGRGFPWTGRRALDLEPAHLSLRTIRERVRVLAGQVTIESNPGRGAKIEIPFPLGNHATH